MDPASSSGRRLRDLRTRRITFDYSEADMQRFNTFLSMMQHELQIDDGAQALLAILKDAAQRRNEE